MSLLMQPDDVVLLTKIRHETESVLREVIGETTDVALLDAPNQRNVGDSLIWAGEVAYFERLGLRVRYAADIWTYHPRDLRRAMPSGIVLIHGGGNLGDIWEGHQRHREKIAADLPDYRIVQLPQSLFFASRERAGLADQILGGHPDLHLLLRDTPSMARARTDLPGVRVSFCPDMALGWDPPAAAAPGTPGDRILAIARADVEGSSGLREIGPDWVPGATTYRTDWHLTGSRERRWKLARLLAKAGRVEARARREVTWLPGISHRFVWRNVARINELNIEGGVELFRGVRGAVVDRLHAHILATLLGVENVLLDNSYGKLSSIYEDYTGGFSTARYVKSLDEARAAAEAFGGEAFGTFEGGH